MWKAFLFYIANSCRLSGQVIVRQLLFPVSFRSFLLSVPAVPLLISFQLFHWLGFFLDEILFFSYRQIRVKQPLFIISIPRSGTTFLHRILAHDPNFTTFTTWEAVLAPSITERKFWLFIVKLNDKLGNPLARLSSFIGKKVGSAFDDIHAIRLDAAEEDYLTLFPVLSCFILILPFPRVDMFWQVGRFNEIEEEEKRLLLSFYEKMLQKHLFFHGQDKIILSKNAAFPAWIPDLSSYFEGSRFICPIRPIGEALKSQLSSISAPIKFCGHERLGPFYRDRFVDLFLHYATTMEDIVPKLSKERVLLVPMLDLQKKLLPTVEKIYRHFRLDDARMSRQYLLEQDEKSRQYRSAHKYQLSIFRLDENKVSRLFEEALKKDWFSL